jgi:hypothetical protein
MHHGYRHLVKPAPSRTGPCPFREPERRLVLAESPHPELSPGFLTAFRLVLQSSAAFCSWYNGPEYLYSCTGIG